MRDDQAIEVESTELLRTLIKNACVAALGLDPELTRALTDPERLYETTRTPPPRCRPSAVPRISCRWSNRSPICEWLRAAPDARAGKVATVEREMAHAG